MKKLIIPLLLFISSVVYGQGIYIPSNPDSIKVPINVLGTVRTAYMRDLLTRTIRFDKYSTDSTATAGLLGNLKLKNDTLFTPSAYYTRGRWYNDSTYFRSLIAAGGGGSTPGGINGQVQVKRGGLGAVTNFTADTVTGRVNADTLTAKSVRVDSARLNANGYINPVKGVDSVFAVGTSITYRLNATVLDSAFASIVGQNYSLPVANHGVSSSLAATSVYYHLLLIQPGHSALTTAELGFNDLNVNGANGYNDVTNAFTSIFSNQYLSSYIGANAMTKYGGWSGPYDIQANAGGKVTNGAYSTAANDSLVTTTSAGTVVTVAMCGRPISVGDGASAVTVFIDGVNKGSINLQNQGAVNAYTPIARYFTGLSNTTHVVKLVNTSGGLWVMDYVGVLNANPKKPLVIVGIPYRNYADASVANSTRVRTDTLNNRLANNVALAAAAGFPVYYANTSAYYPGTSGVGGLDADQIHPSNIGHKQIAAGIIASLANPVSPGILQAGNDNFLYYNGKKIPFANSVTLQNAISNGPKLSAPNTVDAGGYHLSFLNSDTFNVNNVLRVAPLYTDVKGALQTSGPSSGLWVKSRDNGAEFQWYSVSNMFKLYSFTLSGDILKTDAYGRISILNNVTGATGRPVESTSAGLHLGGNADGRAAYASLKIDSGVLMTVPEKGAIENAGLHLFYTAGNGLRYQLDQQTSNLNFITTPVTTTGTVTLARAKSNLIELNPASLLASVTINFPASPNEGDEVILNAGGAIALASTVVTTLTLAGNGKTIYGTAFPTTVIGGDAGLWIYHVNVGWFRNKY